MIPQSSNSLWQLGAPARLDPNLGQFSMSTDVPPPPEASGSVQAPDVTTESMKEAFEEYHSTFVKPAIAQLHDHVVGTLTLQLKSLETKNTLLRTSLVSVEAEMHKRTALTHQVPPFCTKTVIDDNLYYLLNMAQLDRTDVQSVTNHLLTSSTSFIRIVFLAEAMAKQFFTSFRQSKRYFRNRDPNSYSPDTPIKMERDISVTERLERQPLYVLADSLTKAHTSDGAPLLDQYLKID